MTAPLDGTLLDPDASLEWVGNYTDARQAHEYGLVILAMGKAYWVAETNEGASTHSLFAESADLTAIQQEIAVYDREQIRPIRHLTNDLDGFQHPAGWWIYSLWMVAMFLCFYLQHSDPGLTERFASSSTGLFTHGEWWRPFTGLFLHSDIAHLSGNLVSGMLFGTMVSRLIGAARGWTLILFSGTMGNLLTSTLTWPESFVSIGASTAVFGALGILSGIGFTNLLQARIRLSWAKTTAPIVGGIILLGWLGGGREGGNTDVLGHVSGFIAGLVAGCYSERFKPSTGDASIAGTVTAGHDGSP